MRSMIFVDFEILTSLKRSLTLDFALELPPISSSAFSGTSQFQKDSGIVKLQLRGWYYRSCISQCNSKVTTCSGSSLIILATTTIRVGIGVHLCVKAVERD